MLGAPMMGCSDAAPAQSGDTGGNSGSDASTAPPSPDASSADGAPSDGAPADALPRSDAPYDAGGADAATPDPVDCSKTHCLYIRRGATTGDGSGSDWTNACPDFAGACDAGNLERGATYFVASGDYGSYLFGTPESGTSVITIRKATAGDHGTSSGWNDAYGTGPAIFGNQRYVESFWNFAGVVFKTGYHTFDGATGSGADRSAYGFAMRTDTSGADEYYVQITAAQTATFDGMTIRHVAVECSGSMTHGEIGVWAGTQADTRKPVLSDLFIDNCQVNLYTHGSDWIVERSTFGRSWSGGPTSGLHGVPVQDSEATGTIFRNNLVTHCTYICIEGETGGSFYNNVFDPHMGTEGIVSGSGGQAVVDTTIEGNTIVDCTAPILYQATSAAKGNVVRNNLFYNSNGGLDPSGGGTIDVSHNAYFSSTGYDPNQPNIQIGTGSPFVDLAAGNYHLAQPTLSGMTLPAPFDVDMDGKPRGAGGVWDRGAYQH